MQSEEREVTQENVTQQENPEGTSLTGEEINAILSALWQKNPLAFEQFQGLIKDLQIAKLNQHISGASNGHDENSAQEIISSGTDS